MKKQNKPLNSRGHNKIDRLIRLDEILRSPQGYTLAEILTDPKIDYITPRLLRDNLKELEDKHGAVFEPNLYRGRERLWRYKDTSFSITKQTSEDMAVIRKSIENLNLFKGDPRYDLLRFYLMGLENGLSENNLNFMSFDNNNDVAGLEHIEPLVDAIIHQFPLKLSYKTFDKECFVSNIHPYHLRQYNRRWYVFAYSEEKEDILNFPLDRIVQVEHLSKPYRKTTVDFDEFFDEIVGVTNYRQKPVEKVILKVSKKSIDYIQTKPLHWSQKILKDQSTDEYTYIQLDVKVNTELIMLLFSYNDAVEVMEPAWLRDKFADTVHNMSLMYKP